MKSKTTQILTVLLVSVLVLFNGCKKDDPNDPNNPNAAPCIQNNSGTLAVDNYEDDPYYVYVNGAYRGTVGAFGYSTYSITAGTYSTKYTQASGYILYPTEYTSSVTIVKCQTSTVKIQ